MLILTRKSGQAFRVGKDITVTITEISGDRVKIGIEAPRDMRVLREELGQTVSSNQQAVGEVKGDTLRALAANMQLRKPEEPPKKQ